MVERWHPTCDSIMLIAKHPCGDYVRYSDYAALESKLADRVKVKSLEWSPVEGWSECSRERAPAFGGEYQIVMLDPGEGELPSLYFEIGLGAFMFRFEQDQDPMGLPGETSPKKFPSVKAAKAAAQADYERRILSALEATPPAPKVTEAMRVKLWVTVRVEDTGDGLIINADDAKEYGLKPDAPYEGKFMPDGSYRIALTAAQEPAPKVTEGHPMQPVVVSDGGVHRFKSNTCVEALLSHGQKTGFGLNELACQNHPVEDRMQLAQLIGYSVSGYGDLSYVTDEAYEAASRLSEALTAAQEAGKP